MAKQNALMGGATIFLSFVVALVIAGLLISGAALNYPILSFLPETIHTVIGWVLLVLAIVAAYIEGRKLV